MFNDSIKAVVEDSLSKCGGTALLHWHKSSMLNGALHASITSWARPQMPSATEAQQQVETATI